MPAPTLQAMVTRTCMRNINNIRDVGDMQYDLIRPILKQIKNPQQLKEIEEQSPHLRDFNAHLWQEFIKRDIPNWERILEEQEPKSARKWRTFYYKLLATKQQAEQEDEERLAAIMRGLDKQKVENQASFVSKVIPQRGPSKAKAFVDGRPNPGVSGWGAAARQPALKNAKTGRDAMAAIRKQTQEAARERFGGRDKYTMSTSKVPQGKTQIKAAPAWMVTEAMKPKSAVELVQKNGSPAPRVPRTPPVFTTARAPPQTEQALRNAEREARLRALTQPKTNPATPALRPARSPVSRPTSGAQSPPRLARAQVSTATPQLPSRLASSPPKPPAHPGPPSDTDPTTVGATKKTQKRPPSPCLDTTPAPPIARKRPAPAASPFMPVKKKKT